MRLVSQSTRAAIRTTTVIAAFTALVFALLAPLAGPAHAAATAEGYFVFEKDGTTDTVPFSGGTGGDVELDGYKWIDGGVEKDKFHVSCSGDYINNNTARVVSGAPTTPFGAGDLVTITEAHIEFTPASGNTVVCGDVPIPTDPPTEPTDPPTEPTDPPTEPTDPPTEPTDPPTEDPTEEATEEATEGPAVIEVEVLDEVEVADDEVEVEVEVEVLDEVEVAEEEQLPATGSELTRLALLAALIAALGAMLLMATKAAPAVARPRD